ncbi:MAG TPA: chromate efflux transporter [Acidobacteriota bacterium]|nr:chromate efflux transporter [Acidobacteriota bacterium]
MSQPSAAKATEVRQPGLAELAAVFFRIGVLGFGGPAAHIAMMEDEVVNRRRWISRQDFLDLVGATNLIPGPNSTEMAIHLGLRLGGWTGMLASGACFILPAVAMTGLLAWFYVAYGDLPNVEPLLRGIKPAVIAVIALAVWRFVPKAIDRVSLGILAALLIALSFLGWDEALLIIGGGLAGMLWLAGLAPFLKGVKSLPLLLILPLLQAAPGTQASSPSLQGLALFFLKIGCILFGSGYVLVAYLEGELVREKAWLTSQQLIDAIAVGQFTPGPVLTTSTFVGYLIQGWQGALVATVAIFTPSFIFVLVLSRFVPRLRESRWAGAFLDAVNASAVALMAAVAVNLGIQVVTGWPPALITALSLLLLYRFKLNSGLVVVLGGLLGWLLM